MAIEVDKQIIKFESLIVYNNFIALRNEITFKDIEKEISKLILKEFDKYYDDNKGQMVTMTTYTGDWKAVSKKINKCEPFSISFISTKKRS